MKNWTVRTRIIAAFAAVISIMAFLGAVSFVQLSDIRAQTRQLQDDVLPGLLLSAHLSAQARTLLPAVLTQATGTDEQEKMRARDAIARAGADAQLAEQRYRPTITADDDRLLFEAVVSARTRFADAYAAAMRDKTLDANEVSTQLRPLAEKYVAVTDSLVESNKRSGEAGVSDVLHAASVTTWTLVPALVLATAVAIVCAWLLVTLIQTGLARLMSVTEVMSAGDFRQRVAIERRDELGVLGEGINRMADDLTALIGQVQQSGIQVNSSATEIAATSKQQQATATEIAATTSEVGATASRISATSKELARTVEAVSAVATETSALAQSGQGSLERMTASMQQIGEASTLINSRLALLSEKAANIGMVVTTINKVADQTNLLS
ncbi:MAG: methyl-accepting chemotaxis protein, partial [bacterium]